MNKSNMHHMEMHPGENGGVTFKHIMKSKRGKSMAFIEQEEPKSFPFGPDQHEEAMAHFKEHALGNGGGKEEKAEAAEEESEPA